MLAKAGCGFCYQNFAGDDSPCNSYANQYVQFGFQFVKPPLKYPVSLIHYTQRETSPDSLFNGSSTKFMIKTAMISYDMQIDLANV